MKPGRMWKEVLGSLFKKVATNLYPHQKLEMAEKMRGKLKFNASACIGCKLCMRDCPSGAIVIKKVGEKQFEAELNLGKCIYCAQCVDSCLKKALEFTDNIELAQLDAKKLKVVFSAEFKDGAEKQAE